MAGIVLEKEAGISPICTNFVVLGSCQRSNSVLLYLQSFTPILVFCPKLLNFVITQPTLPKADQLTPIFLMLSKKTKYAFHALTYLAENQDKGAVLIQEIAASKNISHKFLENILLELKKAGILGSKKGKGGGYYLIKKPEEITLAKIIRLLNGPIAWLPCVSLNYYEKCYRLPRRGHL
ncbi:BadM/Rrf2 family transcriptional regulator [Pontibacter sp. BAB1700]|nr:BadM/Rrf2 family transcriptional regulator [Pontibacter sp. BAB1700]